MTYNTNFDPVGIIGGDGAFCYGNTTTVGNPFGGRTQSGQYTGPSTGDNGWYLQPPEGGGPMQPYTGVEVFGGLNDFQGPPSGGPPFFRANYPPLNEAYHPPFRSGINNTPSQFATPPPLNTPAPPLAPTHLWPCYSTPPNPLPPAATANTLAFRRPTPNYPVGLDTYGAGPSTQPAPQIPPYTYIPPEEPYGCGSQTIIPDPHPFQFSPVAFTAPNNPTPLSLPGPPSSGPQRTTKRAKEKRKYDPLKFSAKGKGVDRGECEGGWSGSLIHFRRCLTDMFLDRQLWEELSFEPVLAAGITEIIKEDLKQSPLKDTKAGDGKRPRDVEDYLTGILREIIPTGTPEAGRSRDIRMRWAFYEKVADTLEGKLLPVNTDSALRRPPPSAAQVGKGARLEQTEQRVQKNKREKSKRDRERAQLERIGYFFKVAEPRKCWTRTELLSFVVIYFLCGSGIFSSGFVSDAPA